MRSLIPIFIFTFACSEPLESDWTSGKQVVTNESHVRQAARTATSGRVIHAVTHAPIEGARVTLVGTQFTALSNATGEYVLPHRPGFDWVEVTADTFDASNTRVGTDTRLWPMQLSDNDAWRILRRRQVAVDSDDLDDPDLRPEARTLLSHLRDTGRWTPSVLGPRRVLKQALQPPPTIRIYRRGPENNSCQGRVDVIPLEEYVKGVVPHEWIPSWHDESLRAGGIVARSYAWGWIEAGGKYDCADLDDTTRSQVYREDRTTRASAAVDSTAGVGVVRDGAVIRAEYSAENGDPTAFGVDEPLCAGRELFGHGRGMCQWGSQRWATQRGKAAEWMVEHYYPGATAGGGLPTARQVQLELRQRIVRIDEVECPTPASMFNCADFVNQGWSNGLFDLFVDHQVEFSVELTNTGSAIAQGVIFELETSGPEITVEQIRATGSHVSQNTGQHRFNLGDIGPGQTTTIALTLRGARYSIPTGQPVRLRGWVAQIEGVYEKVSWSDPPSRNEGQSYNGGELRSLTEMDVFDPRRWTWSSGQPDMHEGWLPVRGVESLVATSAGLTTAGLQVSPEANVALIESPYLPATAEPIRRIHFRRTPSVAARLWWRRAGEAFSGNQIIVLSETETALAPGDLPANVQQIRLEVSGATRIEALELNLTDPSVTPDLGTNDTPPDTSVPVGDAGVNRLDGRVATGSDVLIDNDPPLSPSGRPAGRALQSRSTGGCNAAEGPPTWTLWALLLTLGLTRRRHPR